MKLISSGTQKIERVFEQIGLTSLNPWHPEALRHSCHYKTACVIYQNIESGAVKPDDAVVLVGIGQTVFHSFLVRDGRVLYDSDNGIYHHESQTYNAENWEKSHFKDDITVLATRNVGNIRRHIEQKLQQSESVIRRENKNRPASPAP